MKLLVFDDDGMVARTTCRLFRDLHATYKTVMPSDSIQEIGQVIDTAEPDVILTDLQVHDSYDGFDIAAQAQARGIPAVLWSGNLSPKHLQMAADKTLLCLDKSCGPSQLRAAVLEVLHGSLVGELERLEAAYNQAQAKPSRWWLRENINRSILGVRAQLEEHRELGG